MRGPELPFRTLLFLVTHQEAKMEKLKIGLAILPCFLLACAAKPKPESQTRGPSPIPVTRLADTKRIMDTENSRLKVQNLITEAFKTVYFPFDRADLPQGSKDLLAQAGELMKREPAIKVLIEGNTDERGSEDYNLALGHKRALAVQEYLISYGIGSNRLNLISYGEERPAGKGHDEKAWASNRRDDFKVTF